VEFGVACDERFLSRQIAVSLGDSGVEMFDRFGVFVGERLVNERPEMFSGLKFRGARRLVDESDPIRNRQVFGSVPAGIIELKHGKHWLTVAKQAEQNKAHTG
jgi:hypothetical protein